MPLRYNKELLQKLQSRGLANKEDRIACVKMISEHCTAAGGYKQPLVIPSKVCAGKQVDRTRLMLAVLAHVAVGNEGDPPGAKKEEEQEEQDKEKGADSGSESEESSSSRSSAGSAASTVKQEDENADVTIAVKRNATNPGMQHEILKEWDKIERGILGMSSFSALLFVWWTMMKQVGLFFQILAALLTNGCHQSCF